MLELRQLTKSFGVVRAVRGVSLRFEPKRIHAVVGENGAGKSTLLKMAAGLTAPDAGEVAIDGAVLAPHTPAAAIAAGIGMVQQHFALIEVFSALENVMLGAEPVARFGRVDRERARAKAEQVAKELGVSIPWDALAESLGIGDRQRLEIARAMYRDARVLILDEPTAVLTPSEADALYAALRRLADGGRAIVVVTHKLDEVVAHADAVSVMRRGELVPFEGFTRGAKDAAGHIAEAIMGGEAPPPIERPMVARGAPLLRVEDLTLGRALRGLSLEARAGEIVGIAGVEGNGQRELTRVLAGLEHADSGSVRAPGIAVVHEDRHRDGLVLDAPVRDNVLLGELARYTRFGLLDREAMDRDASQAIARAGVEPPDITLAARALSGGNQQKIVVIRAALRTERDARILVVAHPTRGVDIGAARAIHAELLGAAARGCAIVVISADLSELRALADRILVMARGRIVAELPPTSSDRTIGDAMLGAVHA